MHTVATWLDLAAHARSVADRVGDPTERAEMLDIARNYEQRAHEVASHVRSRPCPGMLCLAWDAEQRLSHVTPLHFCDIANGAGVVRQYDVPIMDNLTPRSVPKLSRGSSFDGALEALLSRAGNARQFLFPERAPRRRNWRGAFFRVA